MGKIVSELVVVVVVVEDEFLHLLVSVRDFLHCSKIRE